MTKKRKVWAIILMVFGGLAIIGGFMNIKESWPSIIFGLIVAGVGVLLWITGKRKVQKEQERLAAAEQEIQDRTRSFWFSVEDPNQKQIERIYEKQYSEKEYPAPKCEIVPYSDEENDQYGFNVMIDDKKVGEVPRESGPQVIEAINNGVNTKIYFVTNREMAKDGYVYSMVITVKYLTK